MITASGRRRMGGDDVRDVPLGPHRGMLRGGVVAGRGIIGAETMREGRAGRQLPLPARGAAFHGKLRGTRRHAIQSPPICPGPKPNFTALDRSCRAVAPARISARNQSLGNRQGRNSGNCVVTAIACAYHSKGFVARPHRSTRTLGRLGAKAKSFAIPGELRPREHADGDAHHNETKADQSPGGNLLAEQHGRCDRHDQESQRHERVDVS